MSNTIGWGLEYREKLNDLVDWGNLGDLDDENGGTEDDYVVDTKTGPEGQGAESEGELVPPESVSDCQSYRLSLLPC